MSNPDDLNRRGFLGKLGAAAAAVHLSKASAAVTPGTPTEFIDSFGQAQPIADDVLDLGIIPPTAIEPGTAGTQATANATRKLRRRRTSDETLAPNYVQPNILLIMVDQMRYPAWFPGGNPSTLYATFPNITGLRAQSFEFLNYYPAATNCTPSRATLLTGLYCQQQYMFEGANQSN